MRRGGGRSDASRGGPAAGTSPAREGAAKLEEDGGARASRWRPGEMNDGWIR